MLRGLLVMMLAGLATIPLFAVKPTVAGAPVSDDFFTRLEAVALLQTLNGEILASRSATLTLEKWCQEHRLAGTGETKIIARLSGAEPKPPTAEQRHRLGVGPEAEVKHRHVQLVCGEQILSEADNWYVTSRLTEEMNRVLETTATPFGKVVMDLKPYRQTFAVNVLWWPLPKGWETQPAPTLAETARLEIPEVIFEHRAVLYANGLPFSEPLIFRKLACVGEIGCSMGKPAIAISQSNQELHLLRPLPYDRPSTIILFRPPINGG